MSKENVGIVRRVFEAATRKPPDAEALDRLVHPDHRMTSDYGAMGGEEYVGMGGFRQSLMDFDTDWETWQQELDDFLDAGDDAVIVLGHLVARGKSSGAPVEGPWAALVTLREGRMTSTRFFVNKEEALEAAGLRD
jgi:ketosteroid isomerase-like protein